MGQHVIRVQDSVPKKKKTTSTYALFSGSPITGLRPRTTRGFQRRDGRTSSALLWKVRMERACPPHHFSLKAQHTHQPDLRADQHVRHPCSQPEGGHQPSWKETRESSCADASVSVIQLAPFRPSALGENTHSCGPIAAPPERL